MSGRRAVLNKHRQRRHKHTPTYLPTNAFPIFFPPTPFSQPIGQTRLTALILENLILFIIYGTSCIMNDRPLRRWRSFALALFSSSPSAPALYVFYCILRGDYACVERVLLHAAPFCGNSPLCMANRSCRTFYCRNTVSLRFKPFIQVDFNFS